MYDKIEMIDSALNDTYFTSSSLHYNLVTSPDVPITGLTTV